MIQSVREKLAIETIKRLFQPFDYEQPARLFFRRRIAGESRLRPDDACSRVVTWLVGELALPILFIVKHLAKYRSKRVKTCRESVARGLRKV